MSLTRRKKVVEWAREVYEDLDFTAARNWVAAQPKRRAVGMLPVYAPREVIAACGMLPVGIYGGGDRIEIIRGDAFYQSYICHFPRSVIELAHLGRLDFLSAMLFPSTCDVIRNLSGIWQMLYPELYVRYLDLPQIADRRQGAAFWETELRTLMRDLAELSGTSPTDDMLRRSISEHNTVRGMIRALYELRRERPWSVPTEELYLILRAGEVVPLREFVDRMLEYLAAVEEHPLRPKDRCRVLLSGAFCEQPPLGLIKTIERAGCYIVDDDLLIGNRLLGADVREEGDPIRNLAATLVNDAEKCSVLYEPDPDGKRRLMPQRVKESRADGIIFAAPSFCDPALLDRPMLRAGAQEAGIPCIAFKYSENTGQFQQFREQAGTFSDSIKLWGGTS